MTGPVLHEQFEDLAKQGHAARLGMWLFLASEVLLFAGLFALYATYRAVYGVDFRLGVRENAIALGSINTVVLITSSFTVAWAIHATREGRPRTTLRMLGVTIAFGLVFLVLKAVEYHEHWVKGLLPSVHYRFAAHDTPGLRVFFTLYWLMTALHALHVVAGLSVLAWLAVRVRAGAFSPEHHTALENGGLYWHLVDLVWIYLWPLLYLVR